MSGVDLRDIIYAKYPKVFLGFRPLKIGIFDDLVAAHPELDTKDLQSFIIYHTNSLGYVKSILKGTHRVDLQGVETSELTKDDKIHAKEKLKRITRATERRRPYFSQLINCKQIGKDGTKRMRIVHRLVRRDDNKEIGRFFNKKQMFAIVPEAQIQFIKNDLNEVLHNIYMEKQKKRKR